MIIIIVIMIKKFNVYETLKCPTYIKIHIVNDFKIEKFFNTLLYKRI